MAILLCFAFLAFCTRANSGDAESAETSVALLEPEYITRDAPSDDGALRGWLDMTLYDTLAEQDDFILVERQLIDDVLAEHELDRLGLEATDGALRPLLAAGVLVCPVIVDAEDRDGATVTVQAVLAQTGALLAEMFIDIEKEENGWRMSDDIDEPLEAFVSELRSALSIHLDTPSIEVTGVTLISRLERLQWMADDLVDSLSFGHYPGFVLLTPRQPIHTKEERLLRVMGLSEAGDTDGVARLAATSDFQIAGELTEETEIGVSFDRTPVTLTLRVERAGRELASGKWSCKVGDYEKLRETAMNWAGKQLRQVVDAPEEALDESHARLLAQRELEKARRIAAKSYGHRAWVLERERQKQVAKSALRAWHLDPSSEQAGYLAVTNIKGVYATRGQRRTLASYDRIIQLGRRYFDRFGDKVHDHYSAVLYSVGWAGKRAFWDMKRKTGARDPALHPYLHIYVWSFMKFGMLGEHVQSDDYLLWAQQDLRRNLIPSIPDEKIDQEYKFWREFWKEHVEPLEGDSYLPWDCVKVVFAARRRSPSLAFSVGRRDCKIWEPPPVTRPAMRGFLEEFRMSFMPIWDYDSAPVFHGTRVVFPDSVRKIGERPRREPYPRIEFLTVAGGDAWFAAPLMYDRPNRRPHTLIVVPLSKIEGAAGEEVFLQESDVTILPWPEKNNDTNPVIECYTHMETSQGASVWLGIRTRGLARFDKTESGWAGRWYSPSQGVPLQISHLASCRIGGKKKLLIKGAEAGNAYHQKNGEKGSDQNAVLVSLDPETDEITLLNIRDIPSESRRKWPLAITWPDGLTVPLSAYDERYYGDRDLGKGVLDKVPDSDLFSWRNFFADTVVTEHQQPPFIRLWRVSSRSANHRSIFELDMQTLKPRSEPLGKGSETSYGESDIESVLWTSVLRRVTPLPFDRKLPNDLPIPRIGHAIGLRNDLWMITKTIPGYFRRGEGDYVMVYRPAPQDDPNWAENDLWIGPFVSPEGGPVFGLVADEQGYAWASCADAVYRIDGQEFIDRAIESGHSTSTADWRLAYRERLGSVPWRQRVRHFFAEKEYLQAFTRIEKELNALPDDGSSESRKEWVHLQLYRAMGLAFAGKYHEAMSLFEKLRSHEWAEEAAGYKAGGLRVKILGMQGRWRDVLDDLKQLEGALDDSEDSPWRRKIMLARAELEKDAELLVENIPADMPHDIDTETLTIDMGGEVEMNLVQIPAGEFMMGSRLSPEELKERYGGNAEYFTREHPRHRVSITQPFYMGETQVTQEQYEAVMGENPSEFKGLQRPVDNVTWYDAYEFCRRLSAHTGLTVRLPTEAQWEYACRAGSESVFSFGDKVEDLHLYGNYADASTDFEWSDRDHDGGYAETAPVASFRPNAWGLYDMHGNVWEWCRDWYEDYDSEGETRTDPVGSIPGFAARRVLRGGSWRNAPVYLRSAYRIQATPTFTLNRYGFRVVVLPEPVVEE